MAIATANFLAAFLPSGRDACTLVKVELTDPSALTLYLSSRGTNTPGATPQFWQAALDDIGPVVESGNLGTFDPGLATFDFRLTPRPLAGQTVDELSGKLFASYYWYGATVTAYYWETSLTSFTDALQIFKGVVIEYETELNAVNIYCQQRNSWVKRLPTDEVTRGKYPRAPESSIGLPVPICYGSLLTIGARAPASEQGAYNQTLTGLLGLRRGGVRGVPVSLGKGDGVKGRVMFAGHACKLFNSDVDGTTPAIAFGDQLCEIDPIGGDVFNTATGTGFDFNDVTTADADPFDCFFPALALDSKQVAANPGNNARGAVDGFNDLAYGRLDYDAGEIELRFVLGDVIPQGLYRRLQMVICWSTTAGAASLRADFVSNTGGTTATLAATAGLTTPTGAGTTIAGGAGGLPNGIWTLGSEGAYIKVYLTGVATGQKARIFAVGMIYKFRPQWPVATPARTYIVGYRKVPKHKGLFYNPFNNSDMYTTEAVYQTEPEENIVNSQFYATLQGYADSGGTYTGSGTDLIERPPDILRHFLTTYCGETLFETGVGEPGSLVDLRAQMKSWRATDMKAAFAIDTFTKSSDVVRTLAVSTMFWPFISCFTDKWCGVPWKAGRSADFPRRLTRYDLLDPNGPKIIMHRDEVQNDIVVAYSHDAWSRRPLHESYLSSARSGSGHRYRSLRDEHTTVVASESDRIDFTTGTAGAVTVNLTPAVYTIATLREHVDTQMSASAGIFMQVCWGLLIEAGINDRIPFNDGASLSATLTAGDYNADPAALATEAQTKMNAISSNWTVTYSATTRLFTFARSAGTKQVNWVSGIGASATAALAFGFKLADVTATVSSTFAVEPERYVIAVHDTDTIKLRWETGANGIDAATPRAAGALLGFDMARDYDDGLSYALAHVPKNARETAMATSITRYGSRPTLNVDLPYVNDTDTAREIRNRYSSLWKQPPVEVQFNTERMPDLQRGMVFDYDASLDAIKPYTVPGSDGSWLGKKFVAVRVERHSLPTMHQSVVAFEVPAS